MPAAVPWVTTICEICGVPFDRLPSFHRSAEAKGGKVRFCGMKCFGEARRTGVIPAFHKTGKIDVICKVCDKTFKVWPSRQEWTGKAGSTVNFCSKACHGKARTDRIILLPKHTTEANRKKSDGNRAAWGLPPHDPETMKLSKKQRGRLVRGIGFNASQLRSWLSTSCARCGSTERLELDHILCMAAGGKSERENAQTLCWQCNRWKRKHVDKPLVRQQSLSGGHEVR